MSFIGICYKVLFADCNKKLQKMNLEPEIFYLVRLDSLVQALHEEVIAYKLREA